MTYRNYLETLSPMQEKKWLEKKGALLYYDFFNVLFEEFSLEEAGAVLLGLIFYDKTGGALPLPKSLEEVIESNLAAKILFRTYVEKVEAASKEWINRHRLSTPEEDFAALELELLRRLEKPIEKTESNCSSDTTNEKRHIEEASCETEKVCESQITETTNCYEVTDEDLPF